MTLLRAFFRDERGSPAAEMVLMLPLLLMLMFGGLEGGHFFWREHQVVKAAREGARFAGRQTMAGYDCVNRTVDANVIDLAKIEEVTKANLVGDVDVYVTVVGCAPDSQAGIYVDRPDGAPIIRVAVVMDYPALMAHMILPDLRLNATAQTAVMGL